MLSRRNVRIKVMQLLYAERQDSGLEARGALRAFDRMVDESYATLLFDLYTFVRVLRHARGDKQRRLAKLRPSKADKEFQPRAYENPMVLHLANSVELAEASRRRKFAELADEELERGFYDLVRKAEGFEELALATEPTRQEVQKFLLKAHKVLMDSEGYNAYLEDRFAPWDEDKSLVVGAAKKVIRALPGPDGLLEHYRPDEETRTAFGEHLLRYVLERGAELQGHIEPVLENWDAERVALLDMVLLKMALAELLEFPQIPPKVTLNEYVELAKTYSTEKSKDFVNGILDRLLHSLRETGLIVKEGRGLIE